MPQDDSHGEAYVQRHSRHTSGIQVPLPLNVESLQRGGATSPPIAGQSTTAADAANPAKTENVVRPLPAGVGKSPVTHAAAGGSVAIASTNRVLVPNARGDYSSKTIQREIDRAVRPALSHRTETMLVDGPAAQVTYQDHPASAPDRTATPKPIGVQSSAEAPGRKLRAVVPVQRHDSGSHADQVTTQIPASAPHMPPLQSRMAERTPIATTVDRIGHAAHGSASDGAVPSVQTGTDNVTSRSDRSESSSAIQRFVGADGTKPSTILAQNSMATTLSTTSNEPHERLFNNIVSETGAIDMVGFTPEQLHEITRRLYPFILRMLERDLDRRNERFGRDGRSF